MGHNRQDPPLTPKQKFVTVAFCVSLVALVTAFVVWGRETPKHFEQASPEQIAETQRKIEAEARTAEVLKNSSSEIVGFADYDKATGYPACEVYRITTTDGDVVMLTRGRECRIGAVKFAEARDE